MHSIVFGHCSQLSTERRRCALPVNVGIDDVDVGLDSSSFKTEGQSTGEQCASKSSVNHVSNDASTTKLTMLVSLAVLGAVRVSPLLQ